MKKIKLILFPLMIFSQVFALAGFGAYGNVDLLKYPSGSSGDIDTYGVENQGFDNAKGFGFLLRLHLLVHQFVLRYRFLFFSIYLPQRMSELNKN